MKPINEMDYLYASGRIRALEGLLLNRERANRMIDARTLEEAFRVLADCGYSAPMPTSPEELDRTLANERSRVFAMVCGMIPDHQIVDVFRTRYDIHNIKVLLKSPSPSSERSNAILDCGIFPADRIAAMFHEMELRELPPQLRQSVEEAREILARTADPQLMDIALDKACLKYMLFLAEETGSPFLTGYVRLIIDAANLRAFVRLIRMGKGTALLHLALATGGSIPVKQFLTDTMEMALEKLYAPTPLAHAAITGAAVIKGTASPSELDLHCDNSLMAYLQPARSLAFGAPLVVAYLAAKETEITAVRMILSGRLGGIPPESIRERIRDLYV